MGDDCLRSMGGMPLAGAAALAGMADSNCAGMLLMGVWGGVWVACVEVRGLRLPGNSGLARGPSMGTARLTGAVVSPPAHAAASVHGEMRSCTRRWRAQTLVLDGQEATRSPLAFRP